MQDVELLSQEEFLSILNYLRETEPEIYNNEKSREYIDMDKAKNIIKLLLKNEKLNQFLISGLLEQYAEFTYTNQEGIENSTLEVADPNIPEEDYTIQLSEEDFKKIVKE